MHSEEVQIGPFFIEYLPRSDRAGELVISGREQILAYGDFVMKEDWDAFTKALQELSAIVP